MKVIDFFKNRYIYFGISICIILTGVIFALVNGIKLDIQFQGGSILKYTYVGEINSEEAGALVEEALGKTANAQEQTTVAKEEQMLIISLADKASITSQEQEIVTSTLTQAYPDAQLNLAESLSVEPYTGARFFTRGIISILLSFSLILIYVGYRFRRIGGFSAGFMAIVALFHDAIVVTSVFIIFQIPLNDSFIAAVLTIIGFSINDTIVIYDRIRENKLLMGPRTSTADLVNTSITQSMSRSINTNIAVFVSITIVYVFAQIYNIESIKDFALPMMFGTISGCYSTICIAGPLWTMWKNNHGESKLKKA
ncbi:MAG: protein translocase subunit SecF [Oscillospiraceae bacterium]|nr:protein translocase subunit SecF [Oscillospiraceae bacterium]